MKKQIKLLVEKLFDDLYDIEDEKNIDTDLTDEYIKYDFGDIYYQNKKPYAICLGADDFKDFTNRFILLTKNTPELSWLKKGTNNIRYNITEPQFHKFDKLVDEIEDKIDEGEISKDDYDEDDPDLKKYFGFNVWGINNVLEIDENGYENTQIIKNNYDLNNYLAFKYCCELGDNVYLPAIDELQYMFCRLKGLQKNYYNKLKEHLQLQYTYLWSSSVLYLGSPFYMYYNFNDNRARIDTNYDIRGYHVLPFVRL